MKLISKQLTQVIFLLFMLFNVRLATAQVKKTHPVSNQLKEFYTVLSDANASFKFPQGFKEIKAVNNEDFSFDYAMEIPGKDFEVWFQVKSQQSDWASYEKSKTDKNKLANPDSLYLEMGKAEASAFADKEYLMKDIPADVLARYNADAGKSYLLNLLDMTATKHYKYALLLTLQKNHTGVVIAVCFTNDKNAEFYKNFDKASNCLKFKS